MKKFFFTFISLMVLSFSTLFAQTHTSLHFGGSFPMGSFGESNVDKGKWALLGSSDQGGAGLGFNVGLKMKFDIPSISGLGVIATADFIFNGLNSDVKDFVEELEDEADEDITTPRYMNIPIMVGANYAYPLSSAVSVYGEAALGLNIRKITDFKESYEYSSVEGETSLKYDVATSFAFQLGAGFLFNEKFSIGVNYYILGSAQVKGKMEDDYDYTKESDSEKFKFKDVSPSMLLVRLGFHF